MVICLVYTPLLLYPNHYVSVPNRCKYYQRRKGSNMRSMTSVKELVKPQVVTAK